MEARMGRQSAWWTLGPRIDGGHGDIGIARADAWLDVWRNGPKKCDEVFLDKEEIGREGGYPLSTNWVDGIEDGESAAAWAVRDAEGIEELFRGLVANGMDRLAARIFSERLAGTSGDEGTTVIAARGPGSRRAAGFLAVDRTVSTDEDGKVSYDVRILQFVEPHNATVRAALIASFGLQALADQEALAVSMHRSGVAARAETFCHSEQDEHDDLARELADQVDYAQDMLFGLEGDEAPEGFDFETLRLERSQPLLY